jgi:hypothetical protein
MSSKDDDEKRNDDAKLSVSLAIPPGEYRALPYGAYPGESGTEHALQDRVVAQLNQAHDDHGRAHVLALGRIVIDHLFSGSAHAFVTRERAHVTFQTLSHRPDLRVPYRALWYAAQIVAVLDALPCDLQGRLPPSHLRLLVHVRDCRLREQLAVDAAETKQSKRQLEQAIENAAPVVDPDQPRRGRRKLPGWARGEGQLQALAERLAAERPTTGTVRRLGVDRARRRLAEVDGAMRRLRELEAALTECLRECGDVA